MKTIQARRTRHAGHCWRSKDGLIRDILLRHMAKQKHDDQLEHTYSSYVRIRDVALKTCQRRWIIWRSGERRSGISVLVARHDHDDSIEHNLFVCTQLSKRIDKYLDLDRELNNCGIQEQGIGKLFLIHLERSLKIRKNNLTNLKWEEESRPPRLKHC